MIWPGKNAEASWEIFLDSKLLTFLGLFFLMGLFAGHVAGVSLASFHLARRTAKGTEMM